MKTEDVIDHLKSILDLQENIALRGRLTVPQNPFNKEAAELALSLLNSISNENELVSLFWAIIGVDIYKPDVSSDSNLAKERYVDFDRIWVNSRGIRFLVYVYSQRFNDILLFVESHIGEYKAHEFSLFFSGCLYLLRNEPNRFTQNQLVGIDRLLPVWSLKLPARPAFGGDPVVAENGFALDSLASILGKELRAILYGRTKEKFMPVNMEINRDEELVRQAIGRFKLPEELSETLDRINVRLSASSDDLDHASLIADIRSFFEGLVKEMAKKIDIPTRCKLATFGGCRDFFKQRDVALTNDKSDALLNALYGFLSNEGAHALVSRSENVRISKNMVIELSLFLLESLEKRGFHCADLIDA